MSVARDHSSESRPLGYWETAYTAWNAVRASPAVATVSERSSMMAGSSGLRMNRPPCRTAHPSRRTASIRPA
jgi:hypothetical protein